MKAVSTTAVRLISVTLLFYLPWGCGYTFNVGGAESVVGSSTADPSMGPDGEALRVSIPNFYNTSFEPSLAVKYSEYLRREFSAGSGARVVSNEETADYLLRGQIVSVSIPALTYTDQNTFENRTIVTVKLTASDLRTKAKKVVWEQSSTGASEYFITNDLQVNAALQRRSLEQAGEQIVGDLATRFLLYLQTGRGTGLAEDHTPGDPNAQLAPAQAQVERATTLKPIKDPVTP